MAKEKITNSASHVLWSAVFSHEDKCQASAVLVYNHILFSTKSYAEMGIFVEPRPKILETLCGKVFVPKEGPEVSPAPRGDTVALMMMSPQVRWNLCAALISLKCLYPTWISLYSQSDMGSLSPWTTRPNSTCIFPVEIIMPF